MLETDWRKAQKKLEGKCYVCNGVLPNHKGVCPVEGEQIKKRYDKLDKAIKHINDIAEEILKKHRKNV